MGVVGAGLIAQVMHLHYLRELPDHYEVAGLYDIVPDNAAEVARRFNIARTFSPTGTELLAETWTPYLSDIRQPRADCHRGRAARSARPGGEADVLLARPKAARWSRPPRRPA